MGIRKRTPVVPWEALLIGANPRSRLPDGLWPSDHAAVEAGDRRQHLVELCHQASANERSYIKGEPYDLEVRFRGSDHRPLAWLATPASANDLQRVLLKKRIPFLREWIDFDNPTIYF